MSLFRDGAFVGEALAEAGGLEVANSLLVFGSMAVSPDGSRLAVEFSDRFSTSIYDFDGATEREVPDVFGPGRWTADGTQVVYANDGALTVVSATDLFAQEVAFVDFADLALPSPDGSKWAVLGEVAGAEGLWLYELADETWTLLVPGFSFEFDLGSLLWTPDGSRLFYKADPFGGASWRLVDVATAAVQVIESAAGYSLGDLSPDGSRAVVTSLEADGEAVWLVDLASGDRTEPVPGARDLREPRFSPDGRRLALLDVDGFLNFLDLETSELTQDELIFVSAYDEYGARQWRWTANEVLVFNRFGEVVRLSSSGSFQVPDVALAVGDNVFTASASDDGGAVSPLSEPAVVTRLAAPLPDLAVAPEEVFVLPVLPRAGEGARLTVGVTNVGELPSTESSLALEVVKPDGDTLPVASPRVLPALAAGASANPTFDLTDLAEGLYQVTVTADPQEQVDEVSEANNSASTTFRVAGLAAPALSVSTDRSSYLPAEDVLATVEVTNGGDTLSGTLEVLLADDGGRTIQPLASFAVEELGFGESFAGTAPWNTGTAFAGTYRIVARLTDDGGNLAAQEEAAFQVVEDLELLAGVTSDRTAYVLGDAVRLTGTLDYTGGNTVLDGLQVTLSVMAPDGTLARTWTEDLGVLLPGGDAQLSRTWSSAGAAEGTYLADFEVSRLGRPLVSAQASFEVTAQAPTFPALTATKAAELFLDTDGDGRPSPGDELLYRIVLTSVGDETASQVVFEDAVLAPSVLVAGSVATDRGTVESDSPLRVLAGDLAPGEAAEITFRVGLPASWPSGVPAAVNQGLVNAIGIVDLPTDDPATTAPADATMTPVFARPLLSMAKTDLLLDDRDGDGVPSPGD
ncbi:MAG: PD40 domain-containing protein, partial [Acidobacteria bacterium]|nr:PD40 domain-containing protein [Acidobacteriota bacterium]